MRCWRALAVLTALACLTGVTIALPVAALLRFVVMR